MGDIRKVIFEENKLEKKLCRLMGQAIGDFGMIEDGDKVMVCVSGGKDSYAMLDILMKLRERAPIHFEIVAVNLDQKQPNFPADILPNYLKSLGIQYHIEEQDTYSIVKRVIPEGKTTCGLCSRLRRGILYRVADELGATKIALGHHRDDMIQTFMLNIFYSGKLGSMPPKLYSNDHRNIVIRPLAFVAETDIIELAQLWQFPIIPCNLCGSQEGLKRVKMKSILDELEKDIPDVRRSMANALGNIELSHLLDKNLFDFSSELHPTAETAPVLTDLQ